MNDEQARLIRVYIDKVVTEHFKEFRTLIIAEVKTIVQKELNKHSETVNAEINHAVSKTVESSMSNALIVSEQKQAEAANKAVMVVLSKQIMPEIKAMGKKVTALANEVEYKLQDESELVGAYRAKVMGDAAPSEHLRITSGDGKKDNARNFFAFDDD